MISNLIDNSVYATKDKKGIIDISYKINKIKHELIEVKVKDNGKGMSKNMVDTIIKCKKLDTSKDTGYGLGIPQVMNALKSMNGKIKIKTQIGEGSEFILTFPRSKTPKYIIEKIEIRAGTTVIVTDEDESISEIWKDLLTEYENKRYITVKYLKGEEVLNFINEITDKSKILLLVNYTLIEDEMNGIQLIEKCGLQDKAILITSFRLNDVKDFERNKNSLKIIHKNQLNNVPITIIQ
jgi:hypothetical protein